MPWTVRYVVVDRFGNIRWTETIDGVYTDHDLNDPGTHSRAADEIREQVLYRRPRGDDNPSGRVVILAAVSA